MNLADAFIQSNLQCIQAIYFLSVCMMVYILVNKSPNHKNICLLDLLQLLLPVHNRQKQDAMKFKAYATFNLQSITIAKYLCTDKNSAPSAL